MAAALVILSFSALGTYAGWCIGDQISKNIKQKVKSSFDTSFETSINGYRFPNDETVDSNGKRKNLNSKGTTIHL